MEQIKSVHPDRAKASNGVVGAVDVNPVNESRNQVADKVAQPETTASPVEKQPRVKVGSKAAPEETEDKTTEL